MKLTLFFICYTILVFITTLWILLWKFYRWGSWISVSCYTLTKNFKCWQKILHYACLTWESMIYQQSKIGRHYYYNIFSCNVSQGEFQFLFCCPKLTNEKVNWCPRGWEWIRQRGIWVQRFWTSFKWFLKVCQYYWLLSYFISYLDKFWL